MVIDSKVVIEGLDLQASYTYEGFISALEKRLQKVPEKKNFLRD